MYKLPFSEFTEIRVVNNRKIYTIKIQIIKIAKKKISDCSKNQIALKINYKWHYCLTDR